MDAASEDISNSPPAGAAGSEMSIGTTSSSPVGSSWKIGGTTLSVTGGVMVVTGGGVVVVVVVGLLVVVVVVVDGLRVVVTGDLLELSALL